MFVLKFVRDQSQAKYKINEYSHDIKCMLIVVSLQNNSIKNHANVACQKNLIQLEINFSTCLCKRKILLVFSGFILFLLISSFM